MLKKTEVGNSTNYFRFHNDKQISATSARHKVTMDLDAKLYYLCRLEISNVDAADAGTYKAVAANNFGEGFATINLTFEEGVGAKPKIPDGIPPRFPKKPTIRQEGDNLVPML